MSWIGWIVIGALAGMIAKAIMKEEGGFLKNLVLGILGAVLGGWLFSIIGAAGFGDASWIWSLFVAVIGAVVLIWVVRLLTGSRAK